jgi:hypothetical protein
MKKQFFNKPFGLKAFLLPFASVLLLTVFVLQSCKRDEPAVDDINWSDYKNSDILKVQDETKADLTKKLKTITDAYGNTVTLLVASKRAEVVADFLDNTDIAIEIIQNFKAPVVSETQSGPVMADEEVSKDVNGLMMEVVSKSFGESVKAFTLKFRSKRVADLTAERGLLIEYESSLFIEGFIIDYTAFLCQGGCNDDLKVEHWSRQCSLCSYKFHASKSLNPGESWSSCKDARRTKAKLFGDFPISFYDYNFTFWNCA